MAKCPHCGRIANPIRLSCGRAYSCYACGHRSSLPKWPSFIIYVLTTAVAAFLIVVMRFYSHWSVLQFVCVFLMGLLVSQLVERCLLIFLPLKVE